MDYRQRLADLRTDNDLTQAEIAKICGTSKNNVGHWEHLRRDIPIDSICRLCKLYNLSADYILGLTNIKKPLYEEN